MKFITRRPPAPNPDGLGAQLGTETRAGFRLVQTLDELQLAMNKDNQKIRMKPGVYRAKQAQPKTTIQITRADGSVHTKIQQHIFSVGGSHNHLDLRGVVIETPVSVQGQMVGGGHISDCWHINGCNNLIEGGYFRNLVDRAYPHYQVAENEFEVVNDNNTFLNCTFVIKGSIPYGYTDYYGKGGPNFGRLNKHSAMSIAQANNTTLIGCQFFNQSFGHCLHFHGVDGVLIDHCLISGTLRPTADIYNETTGRAKEYDYQIMYRGKRPIPRNEIIPLTEDAVRTYEADRNITIRNTTVERQRGCFQLLGEGDITFENVTMRECGDFGFDVSSGSKGKVVMKNCFGDVAYNPLFNLTRGDVPRDAFYEMTILSPACDTYLTPRSSFGRICGDRCTFIFHDGTTQPLPAQANQLSCGGWKPMNHCKITNYTTAKLTLHNNVSNCLIETAGPVQDNGKENTIVKIDPVRVTTGFQSIFDGRSLQGWHSVPDGTLDSDWKVNDGVIVGTGSADRLVYLVYKEQNLTDFELKLQFRLRGKGNTGVEIRAQHDKTGKRPFLGYHADLGHVGIGDHILGAWDFHFAGRKEYSCKRAIRLQIDASGATSRSVIDNPFVPSDIREGKWNSVHIIAKGTKFQFRINDKVASEFVDNATSGRLDSGAIGLQIHDKGMSVEFKDIKLKKLDQS
ncbi:MAG: DUF1080 domain-containing protein [Rubripirellula sp.]|nr:DUF1080 domain-containing protein [Rubripirellula sp.]